MPDPTAEELALEAMLESRLELISTRLQTLTHTNKTLATETQDLFDVIQAKFKRLYVLEDNLLRIQGKPGLSNVYIETETGSPPQPQPVPRRPAHMLSGGGSGSSSTARSIGDNEIEEIKMGVRTLRRKFQAASAAVTTVGWWRHLKEKNGAVAASGVPIEVTSTPVVEPPVPTVPSVPSVPALSPVSVKPVSPVSVIKPVLPVVPAVPVVPMIGFNAAAAAVRANKANKANANASSDITKLSVDTSLQTQVTSPPTPTSFSPQSFTKPAIIPPKTMLSPTSSSTKKRNTLTLQQIFTPPTSALASATKTLNPNERANPSLGLCSPPMSPSGPTDSPTAGSTLMRGLSLRS